MGKQALVDHRQMVAAPLNGAPRARGHGPSLPAPHNGLVRVLLLDENLFWTSRLSKLVEALGHQAVVLDRVPDCWPEGEVAVVNLGSTVFEPSSTVPALRGRGFRVVGHAGHKESSLIEEGTAAGCDLVVTNSQLTHKFPEIVARLSGDASTK
jgi:hypothetical protein